MTLPDSIALKAIDARVTLAGTTCSSGRNLLIATSAANQTNLDLFADIEVEWSCTVAPSDNDTIEVYLLYAQDATNYEDGAGDGTQVGQDIDPKVNPVGVAAAYNDTLAHRLLIPGVPIRPYPFKVLLKSELDQDASCTAAINTGRIAIID